MRCLLLVLPLFLSACVTNEYFRPHVSWSDSRSFGSMCETNKPGCHQVLKNHRNIGVHVARLATLAEPEIS